MRKDMKQLLIFLVATFIWTWSFYAPLAVSKTSPYQMPAMLLLIFGGMGPSLIGVLMVQFTFDQSQRIDYWRRCFSLKRIRPSAWLLIFLIFPVMFGLSAALSMLFGVELPGMEQLAYLMANPLALPLAALISFLSGPWAEEFGWRGYALDRFSLRFGSFWGSIALGVVWAFWHLPLFLMPDTWHGSIGFGLTGLWMTVVYTVGLSLIMTRVYVANQRSILTGILLHFTSNFSAQLLAPGDERYEVVRAILVMAAGLALILPMARVERGKEQPAVNANQPA